MKLHRLDQARSTRRPIWVNGRGK